MNEDTILNKKLDFGSLSLKFKLETGVWALRLFRDFHLTREWGSDPTKFSVLKI